MENRIHPELREALKKLKEVRYTRERLSEIRRWDIEVFANLRASTPQEPSVLTYERFIPGPENAPELRVKIYEPIEKNELLPAVLMIHGGGYVGGTVEHLDVRSENLVTISNCIVVSVDYRVAPEYPFPAALEDCYATLVWLSGNAAKLGVDPSRVAVFGSSAGGGLTIALSMLARDRGGPAIAFQVPIYPMIDDTCGTRSCKEVTDARVWNYSNNLFCWDMYIGADRSDVSYYAAPSRAVDFSGLPPAYVCVGELDPFRDETIDYVTKLSRHGVPVEFHLYSGCFHAHQEIVPTAEISKRTKMEYYLAVKNALHGTL